MGKKIDLGRRPLEDLAQAMSPVSPDQVTVYPDLYISDVDEPDLLDLPDKGEATIKFKVVHRKHQEEQRGGKKRRCCSVRLEVTSIELPEKKKNGPGWLDTARKSFKDNFK